MKPNAPQHNINYRTLLRSVKNIESGGIKKAMLVTSLFFVSYLISKAIKTAKSFRDISNSKFFNLIFMVRKFKVATVVANPAWFFLFNVRNQVFRVLPNSLHKYNMFNPTHLGVLQCDVLWQ